MKKNTVFLFLVLAFSMTANAQITKGNWMFGGNASFSNNESYTHAFKNHKRKTTELDIKANAGYFFIDNLQAGVRTSYLYYNLENDPTGGSGRNWLKYGGYSRYYFLKPENLVNIFLDGEYFFGNRIYYNGDYKDNLYGYSVSAGPTIFFTNSVALELAVNYTSTTFKGASNFTENNLQMSLGFQIFLEKG